VPLFRAAQSAAMTDLIVSGGRSRSPDWGLGEHLEQPIPWTICTLLIRSTSGNSHRAERMVHKVDSAAGSQGAERGIESDFAVAIGVDKVSLIGLPFSFTAKKVLAPARLLFPNYLLPLLENFSLTQTSTPNPTPNCSSSSWKSYFHPAGFSLHEEKPFIRSSASRTSAHLDCQAASQPLQLPHAHTHTKTKSL